MDYATHYDGQRLGCQTQKESYPAGMTNDVPARSRLIPKGERTRVRIIDAARLIYELGAAGTTLDDVGCHEAMAVLHTDEPADLQGGIDQRAGDPGAAWLDADRASEDRRREQAADAEASENEAGDNLACVVAVRAEAREQDLADNGQC